MFSNDEVAKGFINTFYNLTKSNSILKVTGVNDMTDAFDATTVMMDRIYTFHRKTTNKPGTKRKPSTIKRAFYCDI